MAKVLVTGAAGFIGYHLVKRLLKRGDSVLGIGNLNEYYDVTLKKARLADICDDPRFRFQRLDVADAEGMTGLLEDEKPEIVAHLAAQAGVRYSLQNPRAYIDSNVVGFLNILEGCPGLGFFTVYGPWGSPDMALFLFTKAILNGDPIDVFNHGEKQRDFTYIR